MYLFRNCIRILHLNLQHFTSTFNWQNMYLLVFCLVLQMISITGNLALIAAGRMIFFFKFYVTFIELDSCQVWGMLQKQVKAVLHRYAFLLWACMKVRWLIYVSKYWMIGFIMTGSLWIRTQSILPCILPQFHFLLTDWYLQRTAFHVSNTWQRAIHSIWFHMTSSESFIIKGTSNQITRSHHKTDQILHGFYSAQHWQIHNINNLDFERKTHMLTWCLLHYWSFVNWIYWWPVDSIHKGFAMQIILITIFSLTGVLYSYLGKLGMSSALLVLWEGNLLVACTFLTKGQ